MKRIALMLSIALCTYYSKAQNCVLSGTVKDHSIKELQLELVYTNYEFDMPTHVIKVDANGHFRQSLTLPFPVFAKIKSDTLQQRLLLSAGHDLQLQIDRAASTKIVFRGKAAIENELLRNSILDTVPFFLKGKWIAEKKDYDDPVSYAKVTVAGWHDTVMNQVEKEVAQTRATIQKAAIPASLKKILASETAYAYQNYLYELTLNNMHRVKNKQRDSISTLIVQWQPLPDSLTLESGYFANKMLSFHCADNIYKAGRRGEGGREAMIGRMADYLHVSKDSFMNLVKVYGELSAWNLLYSKFLPAGIQDKILFNTVLYEIHMQPINEARFFLQYLQQHYAHSHYLARARDEWQRYQQNGALTLANTGKRTLHELIKPYKGKVVYLDIWGTWCGPCKKELAYAPELKQRYKGKDVAFVYLDKDEDNRDVYWRKFIKDFSLEGAHYRMNGEDINVIWKELQLAGGQHIHAYPTYLIFDREGKIVHTNAERPSSREKLYTQLDKLL